MVKLSKSSVWGRVIRQDEIPELGKSDLVLIRDAILADKTEEALQLLDYVGGVGKRAILSMTIFRDAAVSRIAELAGEDELERIYRERYTDAVKSLVVGSPSARDLLERFVEGFRGLYSGISVTEEPEKYIMKLDPCGSGGVLRRKNQAHISKVAHPWTWNKSGVSLYCAHCCLLHEIIPIELRGYPICVTEYPKNTNDPCIHLYYKSPESIPDEYFTRVGKTPWHLKSTDR
ncbi:hypothetical protein ACFLXF_03605 [Chloroflexota bacterium]